MALDCLSIDDANDFLTQNTNVVKRDINKFLALTAPWMDVFGTDVWYANVSAVQRSVVQQNVCPTDDPNALSFPSWDNWSCELAPKTLQMDTCDYQYRPVYRDFKGPTFCVAVDHHSFKGSILNAEKALKQFTFDQWNAMNRKVALSLSGIKMTVNSGVSFTQSIAKGFQTNFISGVCPDGPLSWKALQQLKNYLKNVLLANPSHMWGSGNNMYFKFIGSDAIIDSIRDEANAGGVHQDLQYLAAGGFKEGKDGLLAFQWEGPYRGVAFGVDQTPLRLSACNSDGSFGTGNIVPPFSCTTGANGQQMRVVNPQWEQAPYEIAFLMAKGSIYREIPEQFLGEGTTKFDRQYWGGDVQWINNKDQTCNPFGDRGFHMLRFAAAWRPVYPQFIIPILYSRCESDLGVTPCTAQYYTSGEAFSC